MAIQSKIKKGEPESASLVQRISKYFVELKFEWLKITFPERKQLRQSTLVVFVFTIVIMLILSVFDFLLSLLFKEVILPPVN